MMGLVVLISSADGADKKKKKRTVMQLKPEEIKRLEDACPAEVAKPKKERRVLVHWRCDGFFHKAGIPWGNKAIEVWGNKTGAWKTDFSDSYEAFTAENLAKYDALIFNNSTRLKPSPEAQKALFDFVHNGKGMVGIHAATDNFYNWKEGAKMMGGLFSGHPWGAGGTWQIKIASPNHPMVQVFEGKPFKIKDELYQFKDPYTRSDRIVLLQVDLSDPKTAQAGKKGKRQDKDYAMAWVSLHGKGRVFYNALGHNPEPFCDKAITKFNIDGIQFALGDLEVPATPDKQ